MKFVVILVITISFLITLNSVSAISACTRDFIMGASTFEPVSGNIEKIKILKDNGFNWFRLIFNDSEYAGSGNCGGDYNNDERNDYVDCLIASQFHAKQTVGWNYKYDIKFLIESNYVSNKIGLKDLTKNIVTNIFNVNKYPPGIISPSYDDIRIYEVGPELDFSGAVFAGIKPPECEWKICPNDWTRFWNQEAPLLEAAIDGIKGVDKNAKILLQLMNSQDSQFVDTFITEMEEKEVSFDYIGFTYFPTNGIHNRDALIQSINNVGLHSKKAIVVEHGYPANDNWGNLYGWSATPVTGYLFTEKGQADFLRDELNLFHENPNILGLFYNHPLDSLPDNSYDCCYLRGLALNEIRKFMAVGSPECVGKELGMGCCAGCYYTDLTADDKVDMRDVGFVARNFGSNNNAADINQDGKVNMIDIGMVARKFGTSCSESTMQTTMQRTIRTRRLGLDNTNIIIIITALIIIAVIFVDFKILKKIKKTKGW